nr:adenosylcobalamin-dependent ribonucleoside-diphosphate reductase [Gammaproteobacteria bacterium]
METNSFHARISRAVWAAKYRYQATDGTVEADISATWRRVSGAIARVEPNNRQTWEDAFYRVLQDFRFLPGGRILAGAGTSRRVTLFNCFVMGSLEDSMDGLFEALKEGALTLQQGGGLGYDFSTLRPRGSVAHGCGAVAAGPVSFMRIWDSMCATLLSTGSRRGAMMATLRCDHPDIVPFVEAKRDPRALRHFNLSVLVSDAFMRAVHEDRQWPLVFPAGALTGKEREPEAGVVWRRWSHTGKPIACRVLQVVPARELWQRIMRSAYACAEPGVLFIDRINRWNNLRYCETISATNPCGEIPLPAYGACNLGSINLTRFVRGPFSAQAYLDRAAIAETVAIAVRMLDDVVDLSRFPLPAQRHRARGTRRLGLGITGLADTLIQLGMRYDEQGAQHLAASVMALICHSAYRASITLAQEKGAFPMFDRERYLAAPFIRALPQALRRAIAGSGLRNSHLIAIAPAGTISLLANNVSSGIEPVFDFRHVRRVLQADASYRAYRVSDDAYRLWRCLYRRAPLPDYFQRAHTVTPEAHLRMQAAVSPFVDNAISKTINVPRDMAFGDFHALYERAYALGLKGCTTFRPNPVTGAILCSEQEARASAHCCSIEREAD